MLLGKKSNFMRHGAQSNADTVLGFCMRIRVVRPNSGDRRTIISMSSEKRLEEVIIIRYLTNVYPRSQVHMCGAVQAGYRDMGESHIPS